MFFLSFVADDCRHSSINPTAACLNYVDLLDLSSFTLSVKPLCFGLYGAKPNPNNQGKFRIEYFTKIRSISQVPKKVV